MENLYKSVQDRFIFHFQLTEQDIFFLSKVKFMYFSNDVVISLKKSRKSKQENAQEAVRFIAMLRAPSKFS